MTALIDSGATGNFIDLGLLSLANFPLKKMSQPVRAFNVNGSLNKRGTIMWKASTRMLLSKEPENIELMVVGLGRCQIILGIPWLKTWNPCIDWKFHSLSFPTSSPTDYDEHILPQQYLLRWLGLDVDQELSSLYNQWYSSKVNVSPREYLPPEDPLDESIQKITLSTQLAQDTKTTEIPLPKWCKDFKDVFSEKTYNTLPPHCPYDHTIDLKPSFIPKIAKVYPLNPKEKEACQALVEEHLKTRHILLSKFQSCSRVGLLMARPLGFCLQVYYWLCCMPTKQGYNPPNHSTPHPSPLLHHPSLQATLGRPHY